MGTYLSIPLYLRNTVTLEPIAKKADTEAVKEGVSSAASGLQNLTKVMETTGIIETSQVEVYIKGEKKEQKEEPKGEPKAEPKKVFLELAEVPKKVDLLIVKKEELPALSVAPVKENAKIVMLEEENVILLSSDELKKRILGATEEQQKEQVRAFHKKACIQLLQKVKCYETPVDSDDEDSVPLSREELRRCVLRELEHSKKVTITEKSVLSYLKEMSKDKIKTPPLAPVKEESVHDVHPFLLEYGVNPIKTNTIMIDNRMYRNTASLEPVAPVTQVLTQSNKKNKKKNH
jgi:hypothetical protein